MTHLSASAFYWIAIIVFVAWYSRRSRADAARRKEQLGNNPDDYSRAGASLPTPLHTWCLQSYLPRRWRSLRGSNIIGKVLLSKLNPSAQKRDRERVETNQVYCEPRW